MRVMLRNLRLPLPALPTRRTRPSPRGHRVDLRASLKRATGAAGTLAPLAWRRRVRRTPPLVVLCDISGSMERYARMLLHFLHAITNDRDRVHVLLFGTRLTNITRALRHRDVDVALARVADAVADWAGGTRIGTCVAEFNRRWSRRLLGQNAVVLLISDGLDAEGGSRAVGCDGAAAQVVSAPRLAESSVALRGFRSASGGNQGDAAARRRLSAGAQSREPDRARRGARSAAGARPRAGAPDLRRA